MFYETPTCCQILGRSLRRCCRVAAPNVFTALRNAGLCAAGVRYEIALTDREARKGRNVTSCPMGPCCKRPFTFHPFPTLHTLKSVAAGCLQRSKHTAHPPHISIAPEFRGLLLAVPQQFRLLASAFRLVILEAVTDNCWPHSVNFLQIITHSNVHLANADRPRHQSKQTPQPI